MIYIKHYHVDFQFPRDMNTSWLPGENDPTAVGVGYGGGQYYQHVHVGRPVGHCRPGLNNKHFSLIFQLGMGRISGPAAAISVAIVKV